MAIPFIDLFQVGAKLIDKLIPDKAAAAEAQFKLAQLAQNGELAQLAADTQLAQGQVDINKIEAASTNIFVSGWRPAIGWICGLVFFSNYIGVPLLAWLSPLLDIPPPPRLDIGEILPVLLGMLGLGAQRSYDKKNGAT